MIFNIKTRGLLSFSLLCLSTFGDVSTSSEDNTIDTNITLENNRVSCGIEMSVPGGDSNFSFNPFILDFEIYKGIKLRDHLFILGFDVTRDVVSSFRKNNSFTNDDAIFSIWHNKFNFNIGYQKRDLEIPTTPNSTRREEVTKKAGLDFDLLENCNTEIFSHIYITDVNSNIPTDKRDFYMAEGGVKALYKHNIFKKLSRISQYISDITSDAGISFYRGILGNNEETKSIISIFSNNNFDFHEKNLFLQINTEVGFDLSKSEFGFDLIADFDYQHREDLSFIGKAGIKNNFPKYLNLLSNIDDRDILSPLNVEVERDIFADLGISYLYKDIVKSLLSLDIHTTKNKIFNEIDVAIGGNPIKVSNLKENIIWAHLLLDLTVNVWKLDIIGRYDYNSLDKIAFNSTHKASLGINFNHQEFLTGLIINYRSLFHSSGNKQNEEDGYFTLDANFKYNMSPKARLIAYATNILNSEGNYKKDFPIEKMKIKIEFECDF